MFVVAINKIFLLTLHTKRMSVEEVLAFGGGLAGITGDTYVNRVKASTLLHTTMAIIQKWARSQWDCPSPNKSFSGLCLLWSFWAQFTSSVNQCNKAHLYVLPATQSRVPWEVALSTSYCGINLLGEITLLCLQDPGLLYQYGVGTTPVSDRDTPLYHPGNSYEPNGILLVLYSK